MNNFHIMNPEIITGDPSDRGDPSVAKPASFARFVLPFAYEWHESKPPVDGSRHSYYARTTSADWICEGSMESTAWADRARVRYLTPETCRVLYQRAKWFVLKNPPDGAPAEFILPTPSGSVTCRMNAPAIVLFEADATHGSGVASPLQSGLLILEVWYPARTAVDGSAPNANPVHLHDHMILTELFRYWREPFEGHGEKPTEYGLSLKKGEVIKRGEVIGAFPGQKADAGNPYSDRWKRLLSYPLKFPKECSGPVWWSLIPVAAIPSADSPPVSAGKSDAHCENAWAVFPDDRAFTWSCLIHESGELKKVSRCLNRDARHAYATTPWIKFLNIDLPSGLGGAASRFDQEWSYERTYRRWAHWGTLYGFTSHSGTMMSTPVDDPPTWQHFRQIYFDQALLLLYLRVTIFRFSDRLSKASAQAANHNRDEVDRIETLAEEFRKLRLDFTLFTNLYQFPLISNQQQALEMFALLREKMDVKELYDEVKQEIDGTQEFLSSLKGSEQATSAENLTILATGGLLISILLGWLGIDSEIQDGFGSRWWVFGTGMGFFAALLVLVIAFTSNTSKWRAACRSIMKSWKTKW